LYSTMAQRTVVVTGASGYLATEIVNQLISKGFTVRGTVRSLQSPHVQELSKAFPTLQLFEADLLKEGSFDKSLSGEVNFVVHAASPFPAKIDNPQDVIDPALNGTKNVLASVEKNPHIKKVVVTSSVAALVEHFPTDDGTKVWTEDDWNTTSTPKDGPYRLGKALAEKYAWEWADKHPQVSVVTILPSFIIGPPVLSRAEATSIKVVKDLLDGTVKAAGGAPAASFGAVDIRDVARAHVAAIEKPHSKGRYILSSERGIPRFEMAEILRKHYPDWPLPDKEIGQLEYKGGNVIKGKYSNEKARKELEIPFIPVETSLVEMAKKLIDLGVIVKPT